MIAHHPLLAAVIAYAAAVTLLLTMGYRSVKRYDEAQDELADRREAWPRDPFDPMNWM